MQRTFAVFAFLLSASLAFAQLDSNSITVTASRATVLQPDQVIFVVNVTSGLDTSLDNVIAALSGTGITVANFTGINSGYAGVLLPYPVPPMKPLSVSDRPVLRWRSA